MNATLFVIMLLSGAAMLVGAKKHRQGDRRGTWLTAISAIAVLGCAILPTVIGSNDQEGLLRRELQYTEAAAYMLGDKLKPTSGSLRVCLIVDPFMKETGFVKEQLNATVRGLQKGSGNALTVTALAHPNVPADLSVTMPSAERTEEEMTPPLEYWFTAEVLDAVIREHAAECDLFISTLGLPADARKMKSWRLNPRPQIALFNGSVYEFKEALRNGLIQAVVTYNPRGGVWDQPAPKDPRIAFEKRYLLITPENVDTIAQEYGDLFRG